MFGGYVGVIPNGAIDESTASWNTVPRYVDGGDGGGGGGGARRREVLQRLADEGLRRQPDARVPGGEHHPPRRARSYIERSAGRRRCVVAIA
jgi:hypothetical protein